MCVNMRVKSTSVVADVNVHKTPPISAYYSSVSVVKAQERGMRVTNQNWHGTIGHMSMLQTDAEF